MAIQHVSQWGSFIKKVTKQQNSKTKQKIDKFSRDTTAEGHRCGHGVFHSIWLGQAFALEPSTRSGASNEVW